VYFLIYRYTTGISAVVSERFPVLAIAKGCTTVHCIYVYVLTRPDENAAIYQSHDFWPISISCACPFITEPGRPGRDPAGAGLLPAAVLAGGEPLPHQRNAT
jgi:hypothetical protein